MPTNPRVKVLMSTYNGASWLNEQLSSIFDQTEVDVTLVIRDDGSTDDTISILKKEKEKENERFDFSVGLNLGPGKSFFELIKSVNCEDFVALSDQDDLWSSDKLSRATKQLLELNDLPALYCSNVQFISNNKWNLKVSNLPNPKLPLSLFQNSAMGCTIVFNKKAHEVIKKSSGRDMIMHDWYIFLIVLATGKVIFDSQPGISYRLHEKQFIGWRRKRTITTILSRKIFRDVFNQSQSISDEYASTLTPEAKEILGRLKSIKTSGFARRVVLVFKGNFSLRQSAYQDLWTKLRLLFL